MKNEYFLKNYRFPKMYKQYELSKIIFNKISSQQLSWFTGFWEGEGSVSKISGNSFRFTIGQKDITPLCYIRKLLKVGVILHKPGKHLFYSYELNGTGRIMALIETMLPFMKSIVRIKKVKVILKLLNTIKNKASQYKESVENK